MPETREAGAALVSTGARQTAERIGSGRGLAGIVVFNPSGWARTDVVKVFVPFSTVPTTYEVAVQDDRDGTKVATTTAPQENAEHRPAGRFLQFLAKDVPALGYARFNIVEGVPVPVDVSQPGQPVIENEYYRVSFSPLDASIGSIIQRDNGRELVNTDAILGLNAYVFDRYGSSTKVDHLSGRLFTRQLDLIAERVTGENAVVVRRETSQLGDSITVDTRAPGCERLLTTISTWREIPRVDITNRMFKLRTVEKQSVFFAFPFAVTAPELIYELPGIGTSASAATVPGCPQHMRAIRHWVTLAEDTGGTAWATVDAPLVQFGDIHSPYTPFPGTLRLSRPEPGTVYSWALNNLWDTNFPTEQGGEMKFRYAISSQEGGDARGLGMRLGESVSSPLVGTVVPIATAGKELPPSGSLCAIDRPEVRLVQATASERGGDLLLWLNNQGDDEVATGITFPDIAVRAARVGNVFEAGQDPITVAAGAVRISLKPGETRALALNLVQEGSAS